MLENSTLKFTNATKFNDPFDCHPSLISFSNWQFGNIKEKYAEFVQKLSFHYYCWVCLDAWICSLSKINDGLLMWSYYGNHEGVCIGLEVAKVKEYLSKYRIGIPEGCLEIEVQYKDIIEKPDCFRDRNDTNLIQYQLGTKAKAWSHEKEVRLYMRGNCESKILDYTRVPSYPRIGGECFYSLYLGVRIKPRKKKKVIEIAKALKPNIKIYQMVIDTKAFKLNPVLVE